MHVEKYPQKSQYMSNKNEGNKNLHVSKEIRQKDIITVMSTQTIKTNMYVHIRSMIPRQCILSEVAPPHYLSRWAGKNSVFLFPVEKWGFFLVGIFLMVETWGCCPI